jgi:MraZ protein
MGKFFGTFIRSLDEKNRLQVPTKLVASLPAKFFALRGFEGCLSVYLESDFESLTEKLTSLNYLDEKSRSYLRLTLASVVELDVDSHGRISLPKDIVEAYKISKDVRIIGVLDHFEIWDTPTYEKYLASKSSDYESIAEDLSKGGN